MTPTAGMFQRGHKVHRYARCLAVSSPWIPEFIPSVEGRKNILPRYCYGFLTILACVERSRAILPSTWRQSRIGVESAHYVSCLRATEGNFRN